jgi:hypothetical protein
MKVYVVSWNGGPSMLSALDGVYCVCDTLEKAQHAIFNYITEWKDTLLDVDIDITEQLYFTAKGTWKIERLTMNDTGS